MRQVLLTAALSAGIMAAQSAANQPSIEGHVYHAVTGVPLAKVSIQLSAGTKLVVSHQTDEQGHFRFTGLQPGQYRLSALRPGFLPEHYGAGHINALGASLQLAQGSHLNDIVLRLTPEGVIWGRVLDENGSPVSGAHLIVLKQVYRNGITQWARFSAINGSDNGEFRVSDLDAGRYLVAAIPRQPQKAGTIYAATYYPRARDEQSAVPLTLTAGSELHGIDIRLIRTPAFSVKGSVNGVPEGAGAVVSLFPEDGLFHEISSTQVLSPGNRFDLPNVPAGQYTLIARTGSGAQQRTGFQTVTVGTGPVTGIAVKLSPAFDVPAQVSLAETGGSAAGLASVRVVLRPVGPYFASGPLQAGTDGSGRMTFRSLSPGRFAVDVRNLPPQCFLRNVTFGGHAVPADGVEIGAPAPLEVVLSPTAAMIIGSVADRNGKPLAGATVALILAEGGTHVASVPTDGAGSFAFEHLRPAVYRLLAWENVEPEDQSRAIEIEVGPNDSKTVKLRVIEQ